MPAPYVDPEKLRRLRNHLLTREMTWQEIALVMRVGQRTVFRYLDKLRARGDDVVARQVRGGPRGRPRTRYSIAIGDVRPQKPSRRVRHPQN